MRRHWNNKGRIIFLSGLFALCSSLLFALCLILPDRANSGPYLDSAHGNTSYGVNRTSTANFGLARANCVHCHEQHASIGGSEPAPVKPGPDTYELFYDHWITKCDLFCYECHRGTGYVQTEVIYNYLYSTNYGGEAFTAYDAIKEHFCAANSEDANCGSRHWLARIYTIIKNDAYGWGYPADPDPCSACHNPHLAQRKGNQKYPPYTPDKSTISRPSEHKSNPLNLWGDGSGERMSDYIQANGGSYQAPYYGDTLGTRFEPSGTIPTLPNGSDLTDYVTFCMDCHKNAQIDPERASATVEAIKWRNADPAAGKPDRHGEYLSNTCVPGVGEGGSLRPPYTDSANSNYVLSCTDCHEPHGTRKRLRLIRRFINGEAVAADAGTRAAGTCDEGPGDWLAICERCHTMNANHKTWSGCNAINCHGPAYHGSDWDGGGGCNLEPLF